MIKNTHTDDLDKTFTRLMKRPDFLKAWKGSETDYELGRQIIKARIANSLSQDGLAKKAKTTQAVISRIESMSVSPSIQLVSRIAHAFGKTLQIRFV